MHRCRRCLLFLVPCVDLTLRPSRVQAEEGPTVLDIGTGTGILAVMAVRAGASHVFACEMNTVMCDIAKDVLGR